MMKKSTKVKMGVAGTSLLLTIGTLDAFWADPGGVSPTDGKVLYGINRDSGQLFRYDFDAQDPSNIGVVTDGDGNSMTGIDASASIPGHQNIYGFWTDPDQGLVHLVYINSETAVGTSVGDDLGQGHITGAVAANTEYSVGEDDHDDHEIDDDDHEDDHEHHADDDDDDHDQGHGNDDDGVDDDNSGNSSGVNEYGQDHGAHDGDDDDHNDHADDDDHHDDHADHDDDDDDHEDDHAQTEIALGWSLFAVQTLETEVDADDDHHADDEDDEDHHDDHADDDDDDHDGDHHADSDDDDDDSHGNHADDDGHEDNDHADDNDDDHDEHGDEDEDHEGDDDDHGSTAVTGYRLIQVDHHSGEVTELMTLSRAYDSLATTDGLTFMGTSGSDLYRIDPIAGTETLVGSTGLDEMFGLEFAGSTLVGFENVGDHLVPVDVDTGSQSGAPINIGTTNLGTIIFMNATSDPANIADSYD